MIQLSAQSNALREEELKAGTILLKSSDSPIQFPTNMFIANDDLIKNHKPLLKKFVGVLSDTITWTEAEPGRRHRHLREDHWRNTRDLCEFDKTQLRQIDE